MPAPRDQPPDRWVVFSGAPDTGVIHHDKTDSSFEMVLSTLSHRISVITDDEKELWFINRDPLHGHLVLVAWFWD